MNLKLPGPTLLALLGAALLSGPTFAGEPDQLSGEYVEARSAAVYAGACHYNGELTTAGREAVLAWKISTGSVQGVRLDGLKVIALVSGSDNLAFESASRRSVLLVDETSTLEQRQALSAYLKQRLGAALGTVIAVKTAPIRFESDAARVSVSAGKQATLEASRYPCKHCMMPAQTWYSPISPRAEVAVAQGTRTGFSDSTLDLSWSHSASDNVFIGKFKL